MDAVASLYAPDKNTQKQTAGHQTAGHQTAGHEGKISIITPHGILPAAQLDWQIEGEIAWPEVTTASEFLRFFSRMIKPINWDDPAQQSRFEQLRIHINAAWSRLPLPERQRLQKRLNWRWQLLRYRASPQAWAAVKGFSKSGQFHLINGRVDGLSQDDDGRMTISFGQHQTMSADKIIIATGAGKDPLIQQICNDGYADHLDGQLLLSDEMELRSPAGKIYHHAFALGPPSLLSKGDIMGASSIGRQASAIAAKLNPILAPSP